MMRYTKFQKMSVVSYQSTWCYKLEKYCQNFHFKFSYLENTAVYLPTIGNVISY